MDLLLEHLYQENFRSQEGRAPAEQVKGKQEVSAGKVEPEKAELWNQTESLDLRIVDEASRGKHERESAKINYLKDISLEASERVRREDEWEAGNSLQRQKRCRRGQRKVKEHARMD